MVKDNCFITLEKAAFWLKVKKEVVGLLGGTKGFLTIQDLKYTSKLPGPDSTLIQIEYTGGATAGAEVVTQVGNLITIQIEDTVSTALQVMTKVLASTQDLVDVSLVGNSGDAQVIAAVGSLSAGTNDTRYDQGVKDIIDELRQAASDRVESILSTPVLNRTFTEEHDGSNSNVIKPHQWPVTEIVEIRIDYNRGFGDTSIMPTANYFKRGGSDRRQKTSDTELRIVGNDIVLRDDNEKFVLGTIFSGSILGAIKLKYKAGWGETVDDLPQDIALAGKQLMEFWYMQRENRDLGVGSKGIKGESYTKLVDGIPSQIYEMLEPYQDVSLGTRPVPQRNQNQI